MMDSVPAELAVAVLGILLAIAAVVWIIRIATNPKVMLALFGVMGWLLFFLSYNG